MTAQIGTARRQDTYHPGTRRLFHFTPPVAKATVSVVERHNGNAAPGAAVPVWGCKEVEVAGGKMRRRGGTNGGEVIGSVRRMRCSGIISQSLTKSTFPSKICSNRSVYARALNLLYCDLKTEISIVFSA